MILWKTLAGRGLQKLPEPKGVSKVPLGLEKSLEALLLLKKPGTLRVGERDPQGPRETLANKKEAASHENSLFFF